ncbi:dual specificity protein phosphatase [Paracoccus sp. PAR01]|uniref:dual specificity protein phosphatase family protein n=1 Tax=Paracoccus sp. PAR01 TaxID=2769282 RepID=UPI00178612B5|nr:dual specificity protein phosphatase [Paracoccus sp. PAR01]MBD9529253.1 dual specificity protein phosphatase family protein [Paracoccus sp. PAR01]
MSGDIALAGIEDKSLREPITLIERNLIGTGVDLYIGDKRAASDPAMLARHNIQMVLNCAVNLDINCVTEVNPDSAALGWGTGFVRYYKLGIVDGPGNPVPMMLAGYYQMCGLLEQKMPDKPSYPRRAHGNLLVNCRAGRSRSVTLAALFLHLQMPQRFPALEDAIGHICRLRGIPDALRFKTPKPVLIEAAEWAASMARMIQPHLPEAPAA